MSLAGLEGFGTQDAIIPVRVLLQPTSKLMGLPENAAPGLFVDMTVKEVIGKSQRVALLKVTKSRALFWPKDSGKEGIRCSSLDTVRPDQSIQNPPASMCAMCPFEKRDMQYEMLFYDIDASAREGAPMVFTIRVKGASVRPAKIFIGSLVTRKKRAFDMTVTLKSERVEGKQGVYFVLCFDDPTVPSEALLGELEAAYAVYAAGVLGEEEEVGAVETEDDSQASPF